MIKKINHKSVAITGRCKRFVVFSISIAYCNLANFTEKPLIALSLDYHYYAKLI
jgi:hypothetical protein